MERMLLLLESLRPQDRQQVDWLHLDPIPQLRVHVFLLLLWPFHIAH